VRALAAFAASETGRYYARLHRAYGTDPAAFLEEEDDLMAFNFRAALTRTLASEAEPEPEDGPQMLRLATRADG
jgi:hypothetical protein